MRNDTLRTILNPCRLALLAALLLLALLAVGCDGASIGVVETNGLNSTRANFETLNERKSRDENLARNEVLTLNYLVQVEKGALTVQIENPQEEVVWEWSGSAGDTVDDQVAIRAEEAGEYTIAVVGDGAGGRYELSWTTDDG